MRNSHYRNRKRNRHPKRATRGHEVVFGHHASRACLVKRPGDIRKCFILEDQGKQKIDWTSYYLDLVASLDLAPSVLPWNQFLQASGLTRADEHQGICLHMNQRKLFADSDIESLVDRQLVLILDQIFNPRNLGTILRSAGFFGVDAVFILRDRAAALTPEVVKIASGGVEFTRIYQTSNLVNALTKLKELGYWTYGFDEHGMETAHEIKYHCKTALVIGAEGEGLRRLTKKSCDYLVSISGGQEGIECLNAGVAASVAMALASTSHSTLQSQA